MTAVLPTTFKALTASVTGTVSAGQSFTLTVSMSGAVTLTGGTPTLVLNDGGTATYDATATAALADPTKLVFDYTVSTADRNEPYLAVVGGSLNGASIVDAKGNVPDFTNLFTSYVNLNVVANPPATVSDILTSLHNTTAHLGDTITLTVVANEGLTVAGGTPTLVLNDGGIASYDATATAALGDPTKFVFSYKVSASDHNVPTLAIVSYSDNGATITDAHGNAPDYSGLIRSFAGIAVDDTAACYGSGTRIKTDRGEITVEKLAIGDNVMTMSGAARPIKWIGRRSYSGRFAFGNKDILPICLKAGSLDDNVPQRDLWISPHHAMYLEGVLIEARDLVNGVSIVQAERVETVEYFHIELESHDVIIAEGSLSESFIDDDSRGVFHNAHEYGALYPDAPREPARYCAPRRNNGYEVEAARRRIDARAGLRAAQDADPQALRGYVDAVGKRHIAGWAQNPWHPEAPVCLDILAGGQLIGRILANRYRDDLKRAGFGSGCHGFDFTPPTGLDFAPNAVEVRRSLDGARLYPAADIANPANLQGHPSLRQA